MSFALAIPWKLANIVKIFRGIVVRQHRTDRKLMGLLLREQRAECKKEITFAVLLQSRLDEKLVARFHGALLLSAKYSGSLV